ncbi:MAG TPA: sulfatase-like hydrolase/transferase [Armatimonadota bacterium]|jgi:arylsulfatase A-like enzyme
MLESAAGPVRRPNVIYMFGDQLRHDVFGFRGDRKAITPNFDALAGQSTSLSNAVCVSPVCAASRASLFTGKYTTSTGMAINQCCINPSHRAIAYSLHDAGYRMGYLGKWHLVDGSTRAVPSGPARLGFQHADVFRAYSFNHRNYHGLYWEDDADGVPRKHAIEGYQTFAWTDMAIDFIRASAQGDTPFALFLSYSPPHDDWTQENVTPQHYAPFRHVAFPHPPNFRAVPDPYADRLNTQSFWDDAMPQMEEWRRCYYAMVHLLDDELGRMLGAVREAGIEDETILVYSSDHGEMMGSQGRIQKTTFYEEAARVPFLIRWPGRVPAGAECDVCLNTPDIAPTLLGLLGLPAPEEMEGMDVSARIQGNAGPEPEFALLQGTGHTYLWADGFEWRAVRNKRYTYARYRVDGSELLFDNIEDPYQMRNLAGDPGSQPVLQELREAMAEKMRSLNDEFNACTYYRDHWMAPDDPLSVIASARGPFVGPYPPQSSWVHHPPPGQGPDD